MASCLTAASTQVCLVFDIPSPFDAEVIRTANLFTLTESKFLDIAAQFPTLVKRIHSRGRAIFGERWSEWELTARKIHEQHGEVGEKDFSFHGTLGRSHTFDLGSNGIATRTLGERYSVTDISKASEVMRAGAKCLLRSPFSSLTRLSRHFPELYFARRKPPF